MKILQINAFYGEGSTGNIVSDLYNKQKNQGIEPHIIYWHGLEKSNVPENVVYVGNNKSVNFIAAALGYVLLGGGIKYNTSITDRIISYIQKTKPDIIHLHNLHGLFSVDSINLPLLFEYIKNIDTPIIWTLHDMQPITGRCYHFEYSGCSRWQIGCGKCPQKIYDRQGVFLDRSRKNWQTKKDLFLSVKKMELIAISKWVGKSIEKSFLSENSIHYIYNGVDSNAFKENNRIETRKELGIEGKFAVLVVTWTRRKGIEDYFELAKKIKNDEVIVAVGNIPLSMKHKKLPNNIISISSIKNKERMAQIYSACDVYFNSSKAETFGFTTAESLSCGTPVVGYNTTATPELIGENGVCGFTVPHGDIELLYEKISEIKNNGRKNYSANCRQRVLKEFNLSDNLDKHMELYFEKIQKRATEVNHGHASF